MAYLDSVAKLLALGGGRTSNPPRDVLLNLPLEFFQEIADHLPLQSLLPLTQTCSSLRNTLLGRLRLEARRVSKQELLEFLTEVAKPFPDAWVCQECPAIHEADYRDTPHRRALACPRLRYIPLHSGPRDDYYELHHHHLLAPHTRAGFRINPDDAHGNMLSASYTVTPKVVKGRYVRKCTWRFSQGRESPSHDNLGAIALCCHLPTAPILRTEDGQITHRRHSSPLTDSLSWAFESGKNVSGFCHYCALDFKVTLTRQGKDLMIEAWQDLGPEDTIYEANWRAAVWDSRRHSIVEHMVQNRIVTSRFKWVRKLYGEWGVLESGLLVGEPDSWIEFYIDQSKQYHPLAPKDETDEDGE
ncbi:hypothetical protein LLEC1_05783 [Akanthomyces lecanii]|uniref:F-box domain-containing protein n=1 Tax=Cordyceps confragosa TaxID=2714763 RepID=A0A179ISL0_CORDF|nr:hypothetical protein LLEC1_05783 [Akanthomyces lecanii]